jgi:cytochrome bd-type quinol oxidase subunit 2
MAEPPATRSTADRVASVVLAALAVLAAVVSLIVSPFFVMSTDACGHDDCRDSLVVWADAVTWGGVAVAAVVGVAGMIAAARRRTVMWVWPALALLVVVTTFVIGAELASSAAPGD